MFFFVHFYQMVDQFIIPIPKFVEGIILSSFSFHYRYDTYDGCQWLSRNWLPFQCTRVHIRFLVGFMLLNI
jgi:hypothetical protein